MNGLDITRTGQTRANYFQEYFVDGSGNKFMLLLFHDNKKGTQLFTTANQSNNLQYGLYSRLYLLESAPDAFKDGSGYFEFYATMPDDNNLIYRWKQTSNPMTTTSISGYSNISNTSTGLVSDTTTSRTRLRMNATWWGAVGCCTSYSTGGVTGIPGYGGSSVTNMCTGIMTLYAKVNEVVLRDYSNLLLGNELYEY